MKRATHECETMRYIYPGKGDREFKFNSYCPVCGRNLTGRLSRFDVAHWISVRLSKWSVMELIRGSVLGIRDAIRTRQQERRAMRLMRQWGITRKNREWEDRWYQAMFMSGGEDDE